MAMPDNGKLIACDIEPKWTDVAEPYWVEAGQRHKIDLRIAPALQTLAELSQQVSQAISCASFFYRVIMCAPLNS